MAQQWYDITDQTVTAAAFPEPVTQSRTWSVSWLAAARALRYRHDPAYQIAAFAQALHDTLAAQVPSQQSQLDPHLVSTLAGVPNGPAKSDGIAAGKQQAAGVLAERQGDGLDTASVDIPFTPPPPAPGVWRPTPPTFASAIRAGQGNARPFLLAADNQFDPGPPPSLDSQTYLAALAEVRAYGSATSTIRTPRQTDVALFWEPAINIQYVQVLRAVLADTHRSLGWQARFVAAFNVITTDAQISIYNTKFKYLFWRPVTAIETGSIDPDPSWTPLFTTPRYPDWLSGHGGVAGAAQEVLTAFLGRYTPAPVNVTSARSVLDGRRHLQLHRDVGQAVNDAEATRARPRMNRITRVATLLGELGNQRPLDAAGLSTSALSESARAVRTGSSGSGGAIGGALAHTREHKARRVPIRTKAQVARYVIIGFGCGRGRQRRRYGGIYASW